jgi:DNA-binding FadR family transcriptional regulator
MKTEPVPASAGLAEAKNAARAGEATPRPSTRRPPRRLSTSIAEELLRRIVAGEYPVGTQMPPEPVLIDEFEVSRPVIREAVKSLESAGLVTIRQGDGTIVRERARWSLLDPRVLRFALVYDSGDRLLDDATELRVELERALIAEAAPKLTDTDFAVMAEQLRVMDESAEFADLGRADLTFHQTYRDRAGNELKSSLVRLLLEEMPPPERLSRQPRAMYDIANRQHWEIYRALRDRHVDEAMDAVTRHVREMWTWRLHDSH